MLFPGDPGKHGDGWGILIQSLNLDKYDILYRSLKPIYSDSLKLITHLIDNLILKLDNASILIHSRAASTKMPKNIYSVQPFKLESKLGYPLYLIHNGSIDKEALYHDELESLIDKRYLDIYSDSYFLARYIGFNTSSKIDIDVIKGLKKYVKSALNIGLTLMLNDRLEILIGNYYKSLNKSREARNYYKMYRVFDRDIAIYASSTIIDYYKPGLDLDWKEMKNGEFDIYYLDKNGITRIFNDVIF